jgi:hypothetical protein
MHGSKKYSFAASANAWTLVSVSLSALGSPASLTDLYWEDRTGGAQATFYLDDIAMTVGSGSVTPPVAGPNLTIDAGANRHAISEDIYGVNFLAESLATELSLPVRRWGGNSPTRYDWQNDTYNIGSDWYFENIPQDNPNSATLPDGSAADRFGGKKSCTSIAPLGSIAIALAWTFSPMVPASAETLNCTAITTLPNAITTSGVYCLTGDIFTRS